MSPVLPILPLLYALALAGLALAIGLAALLLAFLAREGEKPSVAVWRRAVHGRAIATGFWLLSAACGFVAAGLFSVVLNVAIVIFVSISYSSDPHAGGDLDTNPFALVYCGLLLLGFVGGFALGVNGLSRRLTSERV